MPVTPSDPTPAELLALQALYEPTVTSHQCTSHTEAFILGLRRRQNCGHNIWQIINRRLRRSAEIYNAIQF